MTIVCAPQFETSLKEILEHLAQKDPKSAKDFKMYLDTIIINIPTKVKKYKPSIYFHDETIKDIEFEGYTIPFVYDEIQELYAILGIVKNRKSS